MAWVIDRTKQAIPPPVSLFRIKAERGPGDKLRDRVLHKGGFLSKITDGEQGGRFG